jgi:transposase
MKSLKMSPRRVKKAVEGRARPCYEFSPRSFDDHPKSFEQGRTPGPTTHTQMSSYEDSTIRVARVPGKRVVTTLSGGLPMENSASPSLHVVAWVGLDWADQAHAVCLQAAASSHLEHFELKHTAEALQLWVAELRSRFPQGRVAIALEQSRGALFSALMTYDFLLLYPIPPKALADYRKALYPSGSKDDPGDAQLLLEFLRKHRERFRPWVADDVPTREIALLVQYRRKLVDQRTALSNRLQALLKGYFPQALGWVGDLTAPLAWDFLSQFPSLGEVQKASPWKVLKVYRAHTRRTPEQVEQLLDQIRAARPLTTDHAVVESSALLALAQVDQLRALAVGLERLEEKLKELFAAHPDQAIFTSFPGAGPALAPRLLAAWGTDRQRYAAAEDMQCWSGAAPVTRQSGKKCWVHWRLACPKFLRQTFQEFAGQSILWSPWARAYYQQMRQRGLDHHPAVRSLAFKWIRIIYRCWKDHTLYDEARYQKALQRRGSPLAAALRQISTEEARA